MTSGNVPQFQAAQFQAPQLRPLEVVVQDCFFGVPDPQAADSQASSPLPCPISPETWSAWFSQWFAAIVPCLPETYLQAPGYELCLRLTNDTEIRALNRHYRHQDASTDVLAFATLEVGHPTIVPSAIDPGKIKLQVNSDKIEPSEINPEIDSNKIDLGEINPEIDSDKIHSVKINPAINFEKVNPGKINPAIDSGKTDFVGIDPLINSGEVEPGEIDPGIESNGIEFSAIDSAIDSSKVESVSISPEIDSGKIDSGKINSAAIDPAAIDPAAIDPAAIDPLQGNPWRHPIYPAYPDLDNSGYGEEPWYLGDIVIAVPTADRQAQSQNHNLITELAWLAAHGFLHLLGWDHPDETSLQGMLQQQQDLLRLVALPPPR